MDLVDNVSSTSSADSEKNLIYNIFFGYLDYISKIHLSDTYWDWQRRLWESSLWRLVHRIPSHQLKPGKTLPNTLPKNSVRYETTQMLQRNADLIFVTFLADPRPPFSNQPTINALQNPTYKFWVQQFPPDIPLAPFHIPSILRCMVGCSGGGDVMLLNFLNVKDLGGSLLGSQLDGLDFDLPAVLLYSTLSGLPKIRPISFPQKLCNKFP